MGAGYTVIYAKRVVNYMLEHIETRRVYDRVDAYRSILSAFPQAGAEYDPYYEAARPPFPCRCIAVPGTPFTLYYAVDEASRTVNVFSIEHHHANPRSRFTGC